MSDRGRRVRVASVRAGLAGVWLAVYGSVTLFGPALLDDADSVHAEVAREMLLRRDWVTLYANGIRYLEKAPLFYWLEAVSMKVLGATTAASRLPLAGCVLLLAFLLEAFARRVGGGARAGLYAGLILLSSFGVFIFTRINLPDMLVCLFLTAAVYGFWRTEEDGEVGAWPFCFAAACALGVLTKGLIGVVFPVGIVGVYLGMTRGWRGGLARMRELRPWWAAAVFVAIAAPWHVLIAMRNPGVGHAGGPALVGGHWVVPLPTDGNVHGWLWFYFANEQLYRYLNLRVPRVNFAGRPEYDTVPLWLFLGLIFVWLMPWSAFLPAAVRAAWPRWRERQALAAAGRLDVLLLVWAAVPLVFFSVSTRQEYYVLPALPAMILLVARRLERGSWKVESRVLALVGAGVCGGCGFFLLHTRAPAAGTDLATLVGQNPAEYALSFGHFLDLNGAALGLFRLPLALAAGAFLLGPVGHWALRRSGRAHGAVLLLAGGAVMFLGAAWQGLRVFSPTLTSYQLARAIEPQVRPEDLVILHGEYEDGSTLGFYLRRADLHICEGRSSNLWYGSFFPDAPRIFESREQVAAEWAGARRVFVWQDPHDPDRRPLELPGAVYVVAQGGGKQVLSNQADR